MSNASNPEVRHTLGEDIYAIAIGASLSAFGIVMLHAAGLVTGGVAGLALTVSYLTGIPVGTLFFVINLPFLALAQRTMGWRFTLKSAITVALLSLLTRVMPGTCSPERSSAKTLSGGELAFMPARCSASKACVCSPPRSSSLISIIPLRPQISS